MLVMIVTLEGLQTLMLVTIGMLVMLVMLVTLGMLVTLVM